MGRIPAQDPGEVAAAAAAAATADALAKVKAAQQQKEAGTVTVEVFPGEEAKPVAKGPSARFFIRGLGSLGEHHVKDYFGKFGEVVEATLVRDKKTQRPRGMAFVSLVPREGGSVDDLIETVAGADSHSIKGVEIEVQEALPKPAEEKAPEVEEPSEQAPTPKAPEEALPAVDPVAQAKAQAQWQMHYLAMAINLSVPDMGKGGGKDGGGKGRSAPY
ncbi:unnamed protein product [Cladocopium goreaui]|uniref:DAZ-associated protein 1 n=1 Tax=Cladocopium goreaui TaxID=2562237 RepID=A0A9P1BPA6_9DINO|nr:unnamed protein product [Cladocopium goreaui]